MTTTYFNAVLDATATPAFPLSSPASSPVVSGDVVSNAPAPRPNCAPSAKSAPHVRLSHAWLGHYLPLIGGNALAVYVVLLKHLGGNECAWPSHETLAHATGLSVSSVKRCLKKLAQHGLVNWRERTQTTPRGKARQTSNAYFLGQIEPPPPLNLTPSPRSKRTPNKKQEDKAKERQTASPAFLQDASGNEASAPLVLSGVVDFQTETDKAPQAAASPVCSEEDAARIALEAQGVSAGMSSHLVSKHGARKCAYQLERLQRQKSVRDPAAWLHSALLRGDRDRVPIASAPLAPQGHAPRENDAPASLPKAPSSEEEAVKRARKLAREREEHDVAGIILATLDEKRQAFLLGRVEREQVSLAQVIKSAEHLALTRYWRERRQ